MERKLKITNESQMIKLGEEIGKNAFKGMVITLVGDLGAGKTTMTKGIGRALNITRVINSPTFTIMKIYEGTLTLYHMDVYRIDNNSGDDYLEEYFYLDGVSVIEWADNISDIIPNNRLEISIEIDNDFNRIVNLKSDSDEYNKVIEEIEL
ncbi:MAG: tRNA (adenosine(37)-N6)-threonylcarbamoyltransferase complex ATPase subunit type 1 TsaE [Bacilli bacterium]|nr:tRNA (adenosine(37)-N6)-threonylcarbamoyltransferase complex ATPase subunit type 1 TsaE [Bacilli bacterium]